MYEAFYGLHVRPFRLTPDPKCLFSSSGHKKALAYLRYGVYRGEGFGVITGTPGTGKTTLMKALIDELSTDEVEVAKIVTTYLGADDTLRLIASSLNVPVEGDSKAALVKGIEEHLFALGRQNKRLLLLVDEAHHLSRHTLEELRMLMNFQLNDRALLQCFLLGQESLRDLLQEPGMAQINQRIVASCHLDPLTAEETPQYIHYCLERSGWHGRPAFDDIAYDLIHHQTEGIPRRINILCDRVLLYAAMESRNDIDGGIVAAVTRELAADNAEELTSGVVETSQSGQTGDIPLRLVANEWSARSQTQKAEPAVGTPTGRDEGDSAVLDEYKPSIVPLEEEEAHDYKAPSKQDVQDSRSNIIELSHRYRHDPNHYHGPTAGVEELEESLEQQEGENERRRAAQVLQKMQEPSLERRSYRGKRTEVVKPAVVVTPKHSSGFVKKLTIWACLTIAALVGGGYFFIDSLETPRNELFSRWSQFSEKFSNSVSTPLPNSDELLAPWEEPGENIPQPYASDEIESAEPQQLEGGEQTRSAGVKLDESILETVSVEPVQRAEPPLDVEPNLGAEHVVHISPASESAELVVATPATKEYVASTKVDVVTPEPEKSAARDAKAVPDFDGLLTSFSSAYASGDVDRLMSLFSETVLSNGGLDKSEMAADYGELFDVTDSRKMEFTEMSWRREGEQGYGEGLFLVTVAQRGSGLEESYAGVIVLQVEKQASNLVITEFFYSYD